MQEVSFCNKLLENVTLIFSMRETNMYNIILSALSWKATAGVALVFQEIKWFLFYFIFPWKEFVLKSLKYWRKIYIKITIFFHTHFFQDSKLLFSWCFLQINLSFFDCMGSMPKVALNINVTAFYFFFSFYSMLNRFLVNHINQKSLVGYLRALG